MAGLTEELTLFIRYAILKSQHQDVTSYFVSIPNLFLLPKEKERELKRREKKKLKMVLKL